MFSDLVYENIIVSETDVNTVLYKYGLDEEEVQIQIKNKRTEHIKNSIHISLQKFSSIPLGGYNNCEANTATDNDMRVSKIDQATDTHDLVDSNVFVIKEENTADMLGTNIVKKKRGRPKRNF